MYIYYINIQTHVFQTYQINGFLLDWHLQVWHPKLGETKNNPRKSTPDSPPVFPSVALAAVVSFFSECPSIVFVLCFHAKSWNPSLSRKCNIPTLWVDVSPGKFDVFSIAMLVFRRVKPNYKFLFPKSSSPPKKCEYMWIEGSGTRKKYASEYCDTNLGMGINKFHVIIEQ